MSSRAFVLDFDGTITERDTIGVLANCGIEWRAKKGLDMRGAWEEIAAAYGKDFEDHVREYRPKKDDRRTLDEEIRYQRSLRVVEERSFGRVSSSVLFEGMGKGVREECGRKAVGRGDVVLRDGFGEFVERLRERGDRWAIVSVNFSATFIRGVVGAGAGCEDVEILANIADEKGVLLGPESNSEKVIATSDAKLAMMKALLRSRSARGSVDILRPVYIGDSGTDIECLVDPDVIGIVISGDGKSSLIDAMKRTGIDVVPIAEYIEESGPRIYVAGDFHDILQSRLLLEYKRAT